MQADMTMDEPGYKAFRDNYDALVDGIQSPAKLADKLFSRELITAEILDNVGDNTTKRLAANRELLAAVRRKLTLEPDIFDVFVAVIKAESVYEAIAQKLTESYEEYSAQKTSEGERRGSVTPGSRARGESTRALHGVCAKGCHRHDKPEQSTQ